MADFFASFFAVFASFREVWTIDNMIGAIFCGVMLMSFLFCLFIALVRGLKP